VEDFWLRPPNGETDFTSELEEGEVLTFGFIQYPPNY
jgi:hypothetical protein